MSKYLQSILGAEDKQSMFSAGLSQLEKLTGNKGVDTRLIADILGRAHVVMRKLGLDTKDTTASELYYGLTGSVRNGTFEELLADCDYVLLMLDNQIISFNIIDVIENAHHNLTLNHQSISHGQRSLRGEISGRYLEIANINRPVAKNTAKMIGLLPESDIWYNKSIYKHKKNK